MCYKPGHVISDCPQLPGEVLEQAARALYYNTSTIPQVDLKGVPNPGLGTTPTERKSYRAAVVASPPSEDAMIEEYPPNLPAARDPVERNIMVETDNAAPYNADSKDPQGACRGECHPLFGLK
jgi:hypothetical protein